MRFIRDNVNISFIQYGRAYILVSLIIVCSSAMGLVIKGMNLGIDFAGGALIEFTCNNNPTIAQIRADISKISHSSSVYQSGTNGFVVKTKFLQSNNEIQLIKSALENGSCKNDLEYRRVDSVGAQIGRSMIVKGFLAICAALVGVMIYLYFRFDLFFAFSGIITLLHDVTALFGFYSLTGLEFNLPSLAAVLTIIGYSINDSVVIFDSVRDNLKKNDGTDLAQIVNISLNKTLARTLFTSITTAIAALVLVFTGGEVLRPFSMTILFGIIIGTYSSIVISSQCLLWTNRFFEPTRKIANNTNA